MTPQDLAKATFALVLLRQVRLTPGKTSATILAAPSEVWAAGQHALDWYNEHHAKDVRLDQNDWDQAQKVIDSTVRLNIVPLAIGEALYPSYLANIQDAPPVLYVKGNLSALDVKAGVAIVGTRKASINGLTIAERIARFFAENNWTVVSGLAMGIDAAAHRGALAGQGVTIAVLAHGLRSASPRVNAALGEEILDQGGAWVSEYPVDVNARPEQFVQRNRIQIGLSAGSIIVEGEERSGTMTQAEFCLRNKRRLFAVLPERADELKLVSQGPLILINKRGATPLRSKYDYEKAMLAMEPLRNVSIQQQIKD
ncbi:DNA-processing protein DprA [Achromobacter xylosoxidans]|uniref:DNA-processing protein DprA n=1 Tax=Alcaligenes xylosoxydans xylosoxydans TaxID=85698 RepID=UPI0006BF1E54|nr:DNA-processing protein DprA [Achromobacter xylosoxidans]CUJ42381.1 DNA protecting protein DprA [Achromobacter xylosoxidans]